jgi:hypothetical protein
MYGADGVCKAMVSCLLGGLNEAMKADMASANIILSLAPTILGYIGPTLTESGLLVSRRPMLGLLYTLGAPTVYQMRQFEVATWTSTPRQAVSKPGKQRELWQVVLIGLYARPTGVGGRCQCVAQFRHAWYALCHQLKVRIAMVRIVVGFPFVGASYHLSYFLRVVSGMRNNTRNPPYAH